jgi:hypothetical protein
VTFNEAPNVRKIPSRSSLSYIKEKQEMEKSSFEELKRKREEESVLKEAVDVRGIQEKSGKEIPNFSTLFSKRFQIPIDEQVERTSMDAKEPSYTEEESDTEMEIDA